MRKVRFVSNFLLTTLFLMISAVSFGQSISQKGKVVDQNGEAVPGAYVLEQNTTNGSITDVDGNFTISVAKGAKLIVSYVGFLDTEVSATGDFLNVTISEDVEALEEVILVGYATGKKRSISGAVERVTQDQMNTGFIATPMDAIRSKVSGLTISQAGGNPTDTPTIRLRGSSSLSGESGPLFIIDGVFSDAGTFASMNAADISEITVLKDAAETAQYGSRGASGVIVVTTMKGKNGAPRIDYNGQFGAAVAYKQLPIMTADEWRAQNALNGSGTDHGFSTNFYEEIQNKVVIQHNHNVSLSMGNQRANTRASIGMNQREGQVKGTENTLFNMRFNTAINAIQDKLLLELGFMGSRRDSKDISGQNLFYSASQFNPTFPNFRNPDTGLWDSDPSAQQVANPLGQLEIVNDNANIRFSTTGRISYKILPELTLAAFGSYNYNASETRRFEPNDITIPNGQTTTGGKATISHNDFQSLMGNVQLTYVKEIGRSSINGLVLAEGITDKSFTNSESASGFLTNYFKYNNLGAAANVSYGNVSSNASENTVISYMARLNYMFDNRYVITVNARTDGSSKLGADHKWGFFPSVSGAWIVSNEKFMKNASAISNLKLRAGYGISGNQNAISAYRSLALMTPSKITSVNGASAVSFAYSANDNPDLQWETKYTFNVGYDLAMFKSRMRMTADYYKSTTKNLLYTYSVPVPPFLYNSLLANIGQMSSQGVEFALSGDVIRTKDWGLTLSGQLAWNKTMVDSLSGMYKDQALSPSQPIVRRGLNNCGGLTSNTGVLFMSEGKPLDYFLVPEFKEFKENAKGQKTYVLVDQNEDGRISTTYSSPDRIYGGQSTPKVTMGTSIQLQYKNVDFTTQMSGAFGHMIYNATSMLYYNMANFPAYNVFADAPNKNIYDIVLSDYWLEKGDYVNIDYMSLGWNAPVRKWKSNTVQKLRVALSCNNVATFTSYSGMTPLLNIASGASGGVDDRGVYPISRTFMFSLQFGF